MRGAGLIVLLSVAAGAAPQGPGDARRGAVLFRDRGCLECHSFQGSGAGSAPDLSRPPANANAHASEYTPARLAALMWNHAPAMWSKMQAKGMPVPALEPREVTDLFTYFYSARFFEPLGNATRGKVVFQVKNCGVCHSHLTPKTGPAISDWPEVADPVAWVREMWNHSGKMAEKMKEKHLAWPRLNGQELADLLVYFKNVPAARSPAATFGPADPKEGKTLFDQKGCANCHVLRDQQAGKVTLPPAGRPLSSLAEIAAGMWNHAPDMQRRSTAGRPIPTFAGGEMNHLIAYLFWTGYFDERGNVQRGQRVFTQKQCAGCHEQKTAAQAPDLASYRGQANPATLTSALWKHGPNMLKAFEQQKKAWPQFAGSDMADLIAYLNRPK